MAQPAINRFKSTLIALVSYAVLVLTTLITYAAISHQLPSDSSKVKAWVANYERECGKFDYMNGL